MNLNTITEVRRVTGNGDEDFKWREGDIWRYEHDRNGNAYGLYRDGGFQSAA